MIILPKIPLPPPRVMLLLAAIALLMVLAWFGPSQCAQRKTAEKQAEVSAGAGEAAIGSAEAAGNIVGNLAAGDDATDAEVARGQAEIAAAAQGKKGAAAKAAACRLKTYRDSPQCKDAPR